MPNSNETYMAIAVDLLRSGWAGEHGKDHFDFARAIHQSKQEINSSKTQLASACGMVLFLGFEQFKSFDSTAGIFNFHTISTTVLGICAVWLAVASAVQWRRTKKYLSELNADTSETD
jgi:hypothetical protein